MTFLELDKFLVNLCFSYDSHNYFSKIPMPSYMKYEYSEFPDETVVIVYIEYPKTDDRYILYKRRIINTLEKHEKEEDYRLIVRDLLKLIMFGKDQLDMNSIILGDININYPRLDAPVINVRERYLRMYKPTAE